MPIIQAAKGMETGSQVMDCMMEQVALLGPFICSLIAPEGVLQGRPLMVNDYTSK